MRLDVGMRWHVGTSGWSYDAWEGAFYPPELPARERLAFYARTFRAVEVNTSFYHLPKPATVSHWLANVPQGFLFSFKGSRYITHRKKLREAPRTLRKFMDIVSMQPGPVIFQLPPHFGCNLERLVDFLGALPPGRRYAMEFRDPSWHDDSVYALLRRHNVAFCLFEKGDLRSPRLRTADFVYVRLHGRKEGYKGNYGPADLREWRDWLTGQGRDAYIFFDNTDEKLYAVENARSFQELCYRENAPRHDAS